MSKIGLIAWREIRGYFSSWLAYVLLAGWLVIAGVNFYLALAFYPQTQFFSLQGIFQILVIVLLFMAPIITMPITIRVWGTPALSLTN